MVFSFLKWLLIAFLPINIVGAHEVVMEEFDYQETDRFLHDGLVYEYGQRKGSTLRSADGYYTIRDRETEELLDLITFDENNLETFVYLGIIDNNNILVVCEIWTLSRLSLEPSFSETMLIVYDEFSNIIRSKMYPFRFIQFHNLGWQVILETEYSESYVLDSDLEAGDFVPPDKEFYESFSYQFRGKAWIDGFEVNEISIDYPGDYEIEIMCNDHSYEFDVTIHPLIVGVQSGKHYDHPVSIKSSGLMYLNGMPYCASSMISVPGNYTLMIMGAGGYSQSLFFVIEASVVNVYDGMETDRSIRIKSNAKTLLLNGNPYFGELIVDAGSYVLSLLGEGEYVRQLEFFILPAFSGVEDGMTYDNIAELWLNCEATLNSERIGKHVLIDSPGEYRLVLYLDGEAYKTCNFIVIATEVNEPFKVPEYVSYMLGGIAIIGLILLFKKK
ncbi:MAG: hypothetical protein JXR38_02445 [Bacilli bacterium]|nr:hypothetical protein [Bacilli bacterium]